jgi:hypothetical protein
MFEHRLDPLLPRLEFFRRMLGYTGATLGLVGVSLVVGTLGYRWIGGLAWVDAFYNASMIMTGMGPVDHMDSTAGKLFASFYALFCGIVFVAMVGIVIAPVAHRVLHRFHLEPQAGEEDGEGEREKKA